MQLIQIERSTMEKRGSVRRRVLIAGKILLEGGGAIDCRIRDRSETGARLKIATTIGIPTHFSLMTEGTGEQRSAEIVWRNESEVGVRFAPPR